MHYYELAGHWQKCFLASGKTTEMENPPTKSCSAQQFRLAGNSVTSFGKAGHRSAQREELLDQASTLSPHQSVSPHGPSGLPPSTRVITAPYP